MLNLFLLPLLLFLPSPSHSYTLPEPCTGTCVNAHDPSIVIRPDGTYFRFSTGGKIAIHTAPDLRGPWTYKGAALPNGSKINLPGNQDLWAPDITLVNNTYHLFYSISTFGSQSSAIGLARSPSLDPGTWTDLGATGIITSDASKRYNAIDPNLISVNGTYHLSFGSFWDGLFQVAMNTPPTATKAGAQPTQIARNTADSAMEGPAVGVMEDPVYGMVVYYHYVDTRVGYADGQKRFGWNKLDFSTGWPVV